ncbi:hypothetical protein FH608_023910 [Nonomuraea phyllanthi]|uniref:Uncharacterized protein n=1 Tax=Nonomuraea phyllanthi TaxID=2219224 RepID=A0A5C4W8Y0_9ACTN|nr:hypothetical protein [Nonomuraea phyllanthi]KAB8192555.1 hypothetical protein FH608_023910 [Nonomuraea phyllanthi]QFY08034.1 hypothetical protein GBF35_16310 [Nonomuraea phyllanthi]
MTSHPSNPPTSPNPSTPEPLRAVAERAQQLHEEVARDLAHRFTQGQHVTARQVTIGLRAQTLHIWWSMVLRHDAAMTPGGGGDGIHGLERYASWIASYLTHHPADGAAAPTTQAVAERELAEEDLALVHIDYGLALIRRSAAREFLKVAASISPAVQRLRDQDRRGAARLRGSASPEAAWRGTSR